MFSVSRSICGQPSTVSTCPPPILISQHGCPNPLAVPIWLVLASARLARRPAPARGTEKNRMLSASHTIRKLCVGMLLVFPSIAGATPASPPQEEHRLPRQASPTTAAVQGIVRDAGAQGIVGAIATMTSGAGGAARTITANANGVFRFLDLPPGSYSLRIKGDGYENLVRADLRLNAGDIVTLELTLTPISASAAFASRLPRMPELGPPS